MRMPLFLLIVCLAWATAWLDPGRTSAQGPDYRHRMTKITETVYRADAAGSPGMNSTSWAFINDADVLVTDSEGSPASARSLLAGVASVTSKPVRYLVDTHFHFDHAYGNPGLPPSVQVIGSEFTRKMLLSPEARTGVTIRSFVSPMPGRVEDLKKQAAAEADPAKKKALQEQLAGAEATLQVYSGNFPLQPPNLTVKSAMSVWSGSKEFQILWIGRAHTAGDLIVYVPSEKTVATGDIVFKGIVGWQGDAFPNEHPETLENLKKLDLELMLPGHGPHVQGRANIDAVITSMQGYLRDEWRLAADAKRKGVSPEDAAKGMDLSRFRDTYGAGVAPNPLGIRRIYDIIDGKVAAN
jgi:glyoxylase-like metal-dependent hydrolase (beta-lactamase superfamily II)